MNEFLVERRFDIGFPLRIVESLAVHKLDIENVTPGCQAVFFQALAKPV